MQWLSLPNHHLRFMQMETHWISCCQAPSFSLTMGTASSVSCMLEAMNRELSSLIYFHMEEMEKTSLLAYSAAYSNICETRRRIWALFVLQISVPLDKGEIAQSSLLGWQRDSELATVTRALHMCRLVSKRQLLDEACSSRWILWLYVIRTPSPLHIRISTCVSRAWRFDLPTVK